MKVVLMKDNAEELKFLVMCYWRFARQHYLVALEYEYGSADVISVSSSGLSVCETEVKISIADLKKEKQKPKHIKDPFGSKSLRRGYVREFYFAMPSHMAELDQVRLICDGRFPYAGILSIEPYESFLELPRGVYTLPPVKCIKRAKPLQPKELTREELMCMAKGMSNSFCNLAFKYMRLKREMPSV
jgi:hypothetical protein